MDIDPTENMEVELNEAVSWPPIPEAELIKGNTLTVERLIELGAMTGDPGSAKWAFRLIALRDELMRNSALAGSPISIRILKGGLHINTDAEAVGYHNDRGENSLQTVRRQVSLLSKVIDPSKLSSAEQAKLDRSLTIWGARMAALKRSTKAIEQA